MIYTKYIQFNYVKIISINEKNGIMARTSSFSFCLIITTSTFMTLLNG